MWQLKGRSTMFPICFLFSFVFICFQNVNNLLQACKELYNSNNFLLVLEYVLSVGNILNAGSNRGGAYGFKLQSLPKVTTDVQENFTKVRKCFIYRKGAIIALLKMGPP